MKNPDVASFLGALAATPGFWRSVNLRVIAIWADDGWHSLVGTAHLDHRAPDDVPITEDLPSLERLRVFQEVLPVERLPRLLQQLTLRGSVRIEGIPVTFYPADERTPAGPRGSYARVALPLEDYIRGVFDNGHAVLLYGESAGTLVRHFPGDWAGIDAVLRRAGWRNLHELMFRGLDDVLALDWGAGRRLVFIAPLEARLVTDSCRLRDGAVEYAVLAGSRAVTADCVLTITGEDSDGRRVARSVALAGRRWGRRSGGFGHAGAVRIGDAAEIHVALHVKGFEVGGLVLKAERSFPIHTPLLMLAHQTLFPDQRSFEEVLLAPQNNEGKPFERSVAKLFEYAGLPTDQPGGVPRESNGPDVLVAVPERDLLIVIEATIKLLMNDQDKKLNRLTKRAADLRLGLRDRGVEVVPVMAVPSPRASLVPVELEEAEKNGVRILCREDLATILSMIGEGKSARAVAHFVHPAPPKSLRYTIAVRNPLAASLRHDD